MAERTSKPRKPRSTDVLPHAEAGLSFCPTTWETTMPATADWPPYSAEQLMLLATVHYILGDAAPR